MAKPSTSSTRTGWRIKMTITNPHKKRLRSSTIFSRCSPTATSICNPVPSLLVRRVIQNFWLSSAIQTIELRTLSSSTGHRPQPYTSHRARRPSNPRIAALEKLNQNFFYIPLICLLFNFSLTPFLLSIN